jgi:hypothetical protein
MLVGTYALDAELVLLVIQDTNALRTPVDSIWLCSEAVDNRSLKVSEPSDCNYHQHQSQSCASPSLSIQTTVIGRGLEMALPRTAAYRILD